MRIANICGETASKLVDQLSRLKLDPAEPRLKRTFKAVEVTLKRNKIKSIQVELEGLRRQFEDELLADIRQICIDVFNNQQSSLSTIREDYKAIGLAIRSNHDSIEVRRHRGSGPKVVANQQRRLMSNISEPHCDSICALPRALSRRSSARDSFITRYGLLYGLRKSIVALSYLFGLPRLLGPCLAPNPSGH